MPGRRLESSSATANVTLYCTWRPSGLTIGLHGQGSDPVECMFSSAELVVNGKQSNPSAAKFIVLVSAWQLQAAFLTVTLILAVLSLHQCV